MHNDTVFGGFFDFSDDDGALAAVLFVEGSQLAEGVVADDVGVEDEEGRGVFGEGLGGEFERAGGAEGLGFDGEFDVYIEFFFVLWMRIVVSGCWGRSRSEMGVTNVEVLASMLCSPFLTLLPLCLVCNSRRAQCLLRRRRRAIRLGGRSWAGWRTRRGVWGA